MELIVMKSVFGILVVCLLTPGCAVKQKVAEFGTQSFAKLNRETSSNDPSLFKKEVRAVSPEASPEIAVLKQQLTKGSLEQRVAACQKLGHLAAKVGNLESIELLSSVMQSDPDMEVRMAATHALSAQGTPLSSTPSNIASAPAKSKSPLSVSSLKQLWR